MNIKKSFTVLITFLILFIALSARLYYFQVKGDDSLSRAATAQRTANSYILKERGDILDRNDIPLTNRSEKYLVVLKPFLFKGEVSGEDESTNVRIDNGNENHNDNGNDKIIYDKVVDYKIIDNKTIDSETYETNGIIDDKIINKETMDRKLMEYETINSRKELREICQILNLNFNDILVEIEGKNQPVIIEVDLEKIDAIKSLDFSGISIISSLKRYDDNSVAKHILGYINKIDDTGEAGLELAYNKTLTLDNRYALGIVTDRKNNILQGMGYRLINFQGNDKKLSLRLTLDYHIQKIVEEVMDDNKVTGAIVVEDVVNGDVVAMASKPDFDQNNVGAYLESEGNELFNRAVASYNLGSIFKIIDVASMFELKEYWSEPYFCSGSIEIGDLEFKCYSYKDGGHGFLDLEGAFALSCNTYFINAIQGIGSKELIEMAQRFGLGDITGVKNQGVEESKGNLPSINSKFSKGDMANISIGQGEIMATPLQTADIIATIANGGIKNAINIVDAIIDEEGNKVRDIRRKQGKRIIDRSIADKIKSLMESVVNKGTGTMIGLEEYGSAAGKTGSAETGQYKDDRSIVHAWFAGYFPQKNPKYSMAVFIEDGKVGGKTAGPLFQEIARRIMEKGF